MEDQSLKGTITARVRAEVEKWILFPQVESKFSAHIWLTRVISLNLTPNEERLLALIYTIYRYRYYIQVEGIALNSILEYGEDKLSFSYHGYVNLINAY